MDDMKKLYAVALAAVMLLAMLTACGGNNAATNNAGNTAGNTGTNNTSGDDTADAGDTSAYGDFASGLIEEGKLIMTTNASFPPYEMTDDNNNVIGIDPDIAQAIADKLGLELQIDNIDFDAAPAERAGGPG